MNASLGLLGWLQMLLVLTGSGGFLGLPPGDRDAKLVRLPPAHTQFYTEWAGRAEGQEGGEGLEGFVADPEIQAFAQMLQAEAQNLLQQTETRDEGQIDLQKLAQTLPVLLSEPGCFYVAVASDEQATAGHAVQSLASRVEAAIVFKVTGETRPIVEAVADLIAKSGELEQVAEAQGFVFEVPLVGETITVTDINEYVVVAYGSQTVARLTEAFADSDASSGGFTDSPAFHKGWEKVQSDRVASVTWFDVGSLQKALLPVVPEGQRGNVAKVWEGLGLAEVGPLLTVTALEEGHVVTRTWLSTPPQRRGLLRFLEGEKVATAHLELIPADADFAVAESFSLAQLDLAVRDGLSTQPPLFVMLYQEMLKEAERTLEISLQEDVLAGFGDVWTLYNAPSTGGFLITGPVLALDVKDPAKAQAVFQKLMAALARQLEDESSQATLEQNQFAGTDVFWISSQEDDMPVAPAFCVTDRQLVMTLHPQTLKSHLRFLQGGGPNLASKIELPAECQIWGFVDSPRLIRSVTAVLPWLATMATTELRREGFSINSFDIPSAAAILPYISQTVGTAVVDEGGVLWELRNPLSATLAIPAAIVPSLMLSGSNSRLTTTIRQVRGEDDEMVLELGLPEGSEEKGVVPAEGQAATELGETILDWLPFAVRVAIPDNAEVYIPIDLLDQIGTRTPAEREQLRRERQERRERRRR